MKLSELTFIQVEAIAQKARSKPSKDEDLTGWKKQVSLEQFIRKEERSVWRKK